MNYRVWEIQREDGVFLLVANWSDGVISETVKPICDLETTNLVKARKRAKELGYHFER